MRRWLGCLLVLGACAPQEELPVVEEPEPHAWVSPDQVGPYAVGVTTRVLERDDGLPLTVEVWYPALPEEGAEVPVYDDLFRLALNAFRDPAPDDRGVYPIVLFSHGFGGVRFQSAFLTEHLASHGYVVVAPDHPRNTLFDLQQDATADVALWRPQDLRDSLDWLLEQGAAEIGVTVDADAVGAAGHSFGSMTVLAAGGGEFNPDAFEAWCADAGGLACNFFDGLTFDRDLLARLDGPDPRIRAVAALAPGGAYAFGEAGLKSVVEPLVMAGTEDGELPYDSEARPVYDSLGSATLASLTDAGHWAFSDLCAFLPLEDCAGADAGFMDPARVVELTNTRVTAHFDRVLRGEERAADWLVGADDMAWEQK